MRATGSGCRHWEARGDGVAGCRGQQWISEAAYTRSGCEQWEATAGGLQRSVIDSDGHYPF